MARESAPDVIGLGMSVLDLVQVVEQFPAGEGVTRVKDSVLMGGGPVPTALCAASRLGAKTAILDRIGDDWRGQLILSDYERFGVSTAHLLRERGKRSSFGTVLVRRSDGERHLLFEEGDFSPFAMHDLPRNLLESCRILHLNGRHWPACREAAHIVRKAGGLVSFDGGAHRYDEQHVQIFPFIDLLIVAADFADRAVGVGDRPTQLARLGQWGAQIVGITDGAQGSWFREAGSACFHQPAFPIAPIVDTTGCGDVFHGAFLASAICGEPWTECARVASAAAALAATALGGRGRLADREELAAFLSAES